MRILFTTLPGLGHVQPLIPLALAAQQRGHDVRFVTGSDGVAPAAAAGLRTMTAGFTFDELWQRGAVRWPESRELSGLALAFHYGVNLFAGLNSPQMYTDLLASVDAFTPDLVVSDPMELGGQAMATHLGVPSVMHAVAQAFPAWFNESFRAAFDEQCEHLDPKPRIESGMYGDLYIEPCPPSFQSTYIAESGTPVVFRRPLSAATLPGFEPTPELMAFLDGIGSSLPLVYVTFGTVFNINSVFADVVDVMRRRDDLAALVTVGPGGDPTMFGDLPANVHVERYVDQAIVLPRCSAIVSHVGSGTLLASLALGIPQVCVPQSADQFTNALTCAYTGAGVAVIDPLDMAVLREYASVPPPEHPNLTETSVSTDTVHDALTRVLSDPQFTIAARHIAAEIDAMHTLDDVVGALETLVD